MDAQDPLPTMLGYTWPGTEQLRLPVNGVNVPEPLPNTVRKIAALKAPAMRAIMELLGMPSDRTKKVNVATLSRYLKVHGTLEPPHRNSAVLAYESPLLCDNPYPHAETYGPSVVCADDVKASAHLDLNTAAPLKILIH